MMDDVFVYVIPLPRQIDEMVTPCPDGFTIYLADRLDDDERRRAFDHAMRHIENGDFWKEAADQVELAAHND